MKSIYNKSTNLGQIPLIERRFRTWFLPALVVLAWMVGPTSLVGQQTVETFTTPGTFTWTVPAGVFTIEVEAWGAGGGGASVPNSTAAGGGGGGGYSRSTISVTPGAMIPYTVGAGGLEGINGGNSIINSTIIGGGV
jgi:hypothetical protein